MLANGIKQTTATTGTGSLALAAVTGYPKLSDAFPIGVRFAYTLLDAAGTFLEAGIGYLSDATTMVRARVAATFTGSSYANSAPTAVSLAGTTTVIATPHAATLESMLLNVDTTAAMRFLTSAARSVSTTGYAPSANVAVYTPHLHKCGSPIASLAVNVVTAVAGIAQIGLYACNENGLPGAALFKSGDIDVSTTGLKVVTLPAPMALPSGWYFTAFVGASGTLRVTGYTSNVSVVMGGSPCGLSAGLAQIECRTENTPGSQLPLSANPASSVNMGTPVPLVYLGV